MWHCTVIFTKARWNLPITQCSLIVTTVLIQTQQAARVPTLPGARGPVGSGPPTGPGPRPSARVVERVPGRPTQSPVELSVGTDGRHWMGK